jgi:MFS family permease
MDGFNMLILSFSLPLIIAFYGLNVVQAGFISTITFLGVVIGGLIFGVLADKVGWVKTFTWSILIFSVFTGLSAISPNFALLCSVL